MVALIAQSEGLLLDINLTNMGWIRGLGPTKLAHETRDIHTSGSEAKAAVDHVENVRRSPGEDAWYQPPDLQKPENKYPFQESTVADEDLPFISSEEVVSKRRPGALSCQAEQSKERKDYWIVVDEIVYDCTSFISDHPGGEQVILSFVGEDCSCMLSFSFLFVMIDSSNKHATQGSSGDSTARTKCYNMGRTCELEEQADLSIDLQSQCDSSA